MLENVRNDPVRLELLRAKNRAAQGRHIEKRRAHPYPPAETKVCRDCGLLKQGSAFAIEQRNKDGLRSHCWDCQLARGNRARKQRLLGRLGVEGRTYDELLAEQGGGCAICGDGKGRTLHIDHDHSTGAFRGLLCGNCNHILGKAHDDIAVLQAAIAYLREARLRAIEEVS